MNAPDLQVYLGSYMAPLAEWLARQDVSDIYINRPGEIWLEAVGSAPEKIAVAELKGELLYRLVRQIAALSAQGVNREYPLLAASLPGGERVQAVIPPATRGEVAIAIRKHVAVGLKLEDYQTTDQPRLLSANELPERLAQLSDETDVFAMIRGAVKQRRNILISGGTSSGKTTFVNALISEIPVDERLILIEDTPELQIIHDNAVGLIATRGVLGEAEVTAEDLLIASLRMRPDRIILGEIRGSEAVTFLRAINTGHPGSMSTIHADSPLRAIDQLALLVLQTGTRMAWDDVIKYVRSSLDIIVQLRHRNGRRDIESVMVID
ncbi:MAG: P-type DNA transfer ATPase VirB11 [Sphingomonadales bacterium]|nr:P-type DNA transfer ATPase VirB11 [Sphingomonadales bacterium]